MARDVSKLPPKAQQDYERIKGLLGEVAADSFADEQSRAFGLDKGTAALPPVAAQPLPGLVVEEPELVVPQFPTVTQLQARTGTGEFAPRPTEEDLLGAEAEALRAQTETFKKQGVPSKEDVQLGIALELRKEGLEPFGASAAEYNRRLREETEKVDYAEKEAMKAVAGARRPMTSGFSPQPPIVGESTLAKDPGQVAAMGGLEAIGEALRPQVLETPEETANRKRAQDNLKQLEDSARGLVEDKTVSNIEAGKKQILKGIQNDFLAEVSAERLGDDLDSRKAEARNRYLKFLSSELPDEYVVELQRDEEEAAFGIAGNEISAVERAKGMASRGLDTLIGFVASDKYDPEVYKEIKRDLGITPDTEAVVESLPMTVVRDLAGLSRFVFNPLLDAAFYDVNPQTKEPLNPDEMGFFPRERSGQKEERAWGKSYIDQSSDDPVTKALREIAVEIATARSLGDDLAAQTRVKPEDEDAYRGIGLVSEIALPLNVLSVPGKLGKVATRGAATGARALRLSDATVDAFETLASLTTRDVVPNIYNTVVLDKKLLAPLQKAAKIEGATLGDELVKSPKLLNAVVDSNRVSTVAAIQAGDQYAALRYLAQTKPNQLIPADIAKELMNDSPAIYRALVSGGRTSVNTNTIAQRTLDRLAKAPQAPIKKAAEIANVPVRQETLDQFRMSRQALRTALIEDLSNTQLGQWSFITPNVVASTKVAKQIAPQVIKNTITEMNKLVTVNPVTGQATLLQRPDVVNLLQNSTIIQRPARTAEINRIFSKYGIGSELSNNDYKLLNTLVAENEVYKISKDIKGGAFAPEVAGRAIASAEEPIEIRSALIQYAKQSSQNLKAYASSLTGGRFISPPPAAVPKYMNDVVNQYAGFVENYPIRFASEIKELAGLGKKPEEIYSALVAKSFSIGDDLAPPLTTDNATKALQDVMQIQFNIAYDTSQGRAILKMIDEYAGVTFGNANLNTSSFFKNAREMRQILVNRFPGLIENEVISTKLGAQTLRRDSLPDTILSYTFRKSSEKELGKIIETNAGELLQQVASESVVALGISPSGGIRPSRFGAPPLSETILTNLNEALVKSLGNKSETEIVETLLRGIDPNAVDVTKLYEALNSFKIDALRRTPGWLINTPDEALLQMNMTIQKLAGGDTIVLLPNSLQKGVADLQTNLKLANQNPVLKSKIKETIADLNRRSPDLLTQILGDIGSLGGRTYGSLIEGMLGGRLLPNITYLSENILSAPLIAAITNPTYIDAVIKAVPTMIGKTTIGLAGGPFSRFGGAFEDIYFAARKYPNAIAITTINGESITNADLWSRFSTARLGQPLGSLGLGTGTSAELQKLANYLNQGDAVPVWQLPFKRLTADAKRRFPDALPFGSDTVGVPMTVATQSDYAFRGAIFKEALRRGLTNAEAASVARETLLDYSLLNRVLPSALQDIKKPFLFFTFSATMSLAMMRALTRGESAENILRMARYHRSQAKMLNVYAPGQTELESLWAEQLQLIGDKPATYTYLRDPIFGQIFWMADKLNDANLLFNEGRFIEGGIEGLEGLGYTPFLSFMKDLVEARPGAVPARHIAFAQTVGLWDNMQTAFDIEEAPIGKMRRGEPTFEGKQYRFKTAEGKQAYVTFMMLMTLAGWNRTVNDYFNTMVASGFAPEGAYLARYYPENTEFEGVQADPSLKGFVNGLLYMIVRGRAVRPPTQIEAYDKQIQTEMRKLDQLKLKEVVED